MRSTKKLFVFIIPIIIVLIGGFLLIKNMELPHITIENIDFNNLEDGTYDGRYDTKLVKAKVRVIVKDRSVISIKIIEHKNGMGKKAESILDNVVEQQTLLVDVISGATLSSNVLIKATEKAIVKGLDR